MLHTWLHFLVDLCTVSSYPPFTTKPVELDPRRRGHPPPRPSAAAAATATAIITTKANAIEYRPPLPAPSMVRVEGGELAFGSVSFNVVFLALRFFLKI